MGKMLFTMWCVAAALTALMLAARYFCGILAETPIDWRPYDRALRSMAALALCPLLVPRAALLSLLGKSRSARREEGPPRAAAVEMPARRGKTA